MLRTGIGWDRHRLLPGRRCVLAGVEFTESPVGPVGFSDGDVVCHAVIDALLGAAALGDIGRHFPDTDPAHAGADSLDLLAATRDLVQQAGWTIVNIDCSVIAERPLLAGRSDDMVATLARVLNLAIGQVSVKATRGEGLGPEGRGDCITVLATTLVAGAATSEQSGD